MSKAVTLMGNIRGSSPILFCVVLSAIFIFLSEGPYTGILDTIYCTVIGLTGSIASIGLLVLLFGDLNQNDSG